MRIKQLGATTDQEMKVQRRILAAVWTLTIFSSQGAAQFLPNGCSRKMPLSFRSFEWGRLLEHPFLEHFCLDHFSVILGKCYMQDSRTPRLLEHFWVPILGASCSNKLFVGTVRPSHHHGRRVDKEIRE